MLKVRRRSGIQRNRTAPRSKSETNTGSPAKLFAIQTTETNKTVLYTEIQTACPSHLVK
ncbi:hypothetical protein N6H14_26795 [Paenibacillus sp. CC-CFT747]|nr:hypothetical protein N6H14_26795 [Paenibacillus sp. CC-CFT747]